jgi:hypothetical protein
LGIRFIRQDELPSDPLAHEFVGEKYEFITEWLG